MDDQDAQSRWDRRAELEQEGGRRKLEVLGPEIYFSLDAPQVQ